MVSDILKEKDRWFAIDPESYKAGLKREKKTTFPFIEEALTLWVENALQAGLVISDTLFGEDNLKVPIDGLIFQETA